MMHHPLGRGDLSLTAGCPLRIVHRVVLNSQILRKSAVWSALFRESFFFPEASSWFSAGAVLSLVLSGVSATAQTFFTDGLIEPTIGVERGSAATIREVDEPTRFLVFNTYGAEAIGPAGLGFGLAHPDLIGSGDQLDLTAFVSGPSDNGEVELLSGGVGYRREIGSDGTTFFTNLGHGIARLGTKEALAADVEVRQSTFLAGLRRETVTVGGGRLTFGASLGWNREETDAFGLAFSRTRFGLTQAFVRYEDGHPFSLQRRFAAVLTKGFEGPNSQWEGVPGAIDPETDLHFWRISLSAEASVPLAERLLLNVGVIGQWTGDPLPLTQRCGYATNTYARGFDVSYVNGDRCIGARSELAYDFARPTDAAGPSSWVQGFAGLDLGIVEDVAALVNTGSRDDWSSFSLGLRALHGGFLGEIALTSILKDPGGAFEQDLVRLWVRAALKF